MIYYPVLTITPTWESSTWTLDATLIITGTINVQAGITSPYITSTSLTSTGADIVNLTSTSLTSTAIRGTNISGTSFYGDISGTTSTTTKIVVSQIGTQTVTDLWSPVALSSVTYDALSEFNPTSYRFTPSSSGWYYLSAQATFSSTYINATLNCSLAFFKNGSLDGGVVSVPIPEINTNTSLSITLVSNLGVGDYIILNQNSNEIASVGGTNMFIFRLL